MKIDLKKNGWESLAALWPALKGSLAQVRKPCIRKNCPACLKGDKHPAWLLAYSDRGKRRCMYVPLEMVSTLQQALDNGRQIELLLSAMGPALIKNYRLSLKSKPKQSSKS